MVVIIAVVVAWALFAFGAVYEWALIPLIPSAFLIGAWLWFRRPHRRVNGVAVAICALLILAVGFQLVPVSKGVLAKLSPAAARALTVLDVRLASPTEIRHPLSIAPTSTQRLLSCLIVGIAWAAGMSVWVSTLQNLIRWVQALTCIALIAALFALIQRATFNNRIYWVWESPFNFSSNYYGPFVNRNHFAGWMIMALSLSAGYFVGQLPSIGRQLRAGWRNRVLWLSSPEATSLILLGATLGIMFVAQVWSLSRSGIGGTVAALAMLAFTALRRGHRSSTLRLSAFVLAGILVAAVSWRGFGTLDRWYGNTSTLEWRFHLWQDSLPVLKQFWLFGSGLNTYGQVMLLFHESDPTVHAQQAHNDYLQLAIEGGLLVVIPWTIAAVLLIRRIIQRLRQPQDEMTWWIRMGAVAGICGIALQETTDFSLQIPGVALLFATVVGIAIHEPAPIAEPVRRRRTDAARSQSPALVTASHRS